VKKQWCIPEVGAEFVWRMEDVLELYDYEEPYDPKKPIVCFDELPYQMVAEKRTPLPQKPGRPQRYDYDYERKGMVNIFAFFEPKKSGWRHLDLTDRRTGRWISPWLYGGWWTSTTPQPRRCGWSSTT